MPPPLPAPARFASPPESDLGEVAHRVGEGGLAKRYVEQMGGEQP